MQGIVEFLLIIALLVLAVFLILLVLIQRGRGGGLVGAFGGPGGQSAFGTKAGDVFTKITIGTALVWILLCILSYKVLNTDPSSPLDELGGGAQSQAPLDGAEPLGGGIGTAAQAPSGTDARDSAATSSETTTSSGETTTNEASTPDDAASSSASPEEE